MGEVPCDQNIHPIRRRYSHVQSIVGILGRDYLGGKDALGQHLSLLVDVKHSQRREGRDPLLRLFRISSTRFLMDQCGDIGRKTR